MAMHRMWRGAFAAAVIAAAGVGLCGCLDVAQKVGIDRMGEGHYEITAAAQGIVGDALRNEKLVNRENHATLTTSDVEGKVTRTAMVDFKSLSELAFSDETMSLAVKSRDLFGLGPSHVAFVTAVMIGKARGENPRAAAAPDVGRKIAQSILGDHAYTFAVTVPGDIENAPGVALGGETYQPTVTGDFYNGRVVTWRIPLYALAGVDTLRFEVDFRAWGLFSNAKSQLVAND